MDKKKTLIVIVAAFVLLLICATALYNRLGAGFTPDRLAVSEKGCKAGFSGISATVFIPCIC